MIITEAQIRRIMPKAKRENVTAFVKAFNGYSEIFGIDTKLRISHFLAQVAVESGELNYTKENLNYSADGLLKTFPKYFNSESAQRYARNPQMIANRVYANRMGNGDEASGDGYRFRGRSLIQLTGKDNYRAYATSEYCNGDLMSHPEWLEQYPGALKAAMFFWLRNGLNRLADADDAKAVSKRINGGYNGLAQRLYYTRVAKRVFGI